MKIKKFTAAAIAFSCVSTLISSLMISANAVTNDTSSLLVPIDYSEHGLGYNIGDSILDIADDTRTDSAKISYDRAVLPSSVDLSSDSAFPPIGDQGNIGSCVAWATTYYAYTYMVHYRKGITSTAANSYSPRWTYNLINGGLDNGCIVSNALKVLKNQGALTMTDCPYYISGNYSFDWSHDTQAMIDALSTRSSGNSTQLVTYTYGSTFLSQLAEVKSGLNNHTPYIVTMIAASSLTNSSLKYCSDTDHYNQCIYVRNASTTSSDDELYNGHAMTIVGYDDSVWCDVNENGIVDDGETGAFKAANSWGTSWGNSGYTWILYDALLYTSQIMSASDSTATWDSSYTTTRVPFFASTGYTNRFYYMESVPDYTVGYVSEVTLSTARRNQLRCNARCIDSNNTVVENNQIYQSYSEGVSTTPISFTGTIILNHECSENIGSYLSGYNWGVRIQDIYNDSYSISGISCKIVDNLDNTISSYYSSGSENGSYSLVDTPIDLMLGDVDYDGELTLTDVNMIQYYLADTISFSNVQLVLADYNEDGTVGIGDAVALLQYLLTHGLDASDISDSILLSYIE